ncbi:MAG TPA: carboxypeptidase-like regulatory domain-containing protein, partial [Herpetosiphonaceae bacterium]|nr:carboxypeptidase-like regulatory domain-containing protein [Herpetosiphonaceae bacterium]
ATTDSLGNYRIALVLDGLAEFGEVRYTASRGANSLFATAPFSATYHQLTELKQDLSFSQRTVRFQGQVGNDLAAGRPLGATSVAIASPLLGNLCAFSPAPGQTSSSYTCDAQVATTAAFSVTYTVSGDWGSEVVTATAAAGATGSFSTLTRALQARPATLRLFGTVSDPANRRLNGAIVKAGGGALSEQNLALSGSTNVEGAYEIYAVLKDGALAGSLDYAVYSNGATITVPGPFAGAAGQLAQVERNLVFNARGAAFSGGIKHALLPWMTLSASRVTIKDAQNAELCAWEPQDGAATSSYSCAAALATTQAVSTTYVVAGPWGTESLPGQVAAGDYASSARVARDLLVTPATLRLRGVARNAGGAPLANVAIEITGAGLLGPARTTTLASGEYEVFALLKPNGASGALSYKAAYQAVGMTASASYAAAPKAITAVDQDFTFSSRRVDFSGQVKSALVSGMAVNAANVTIAAPGLGTLCEWSRPSWTTPSSLYSCSATVFTTAAVSVTYTVNHDWGVEVVNGVVPAGAMGGLTTFTKELHVSPSTLRVEGTVSDPGGAPLANARVVVGSPSFSASNPGYEVRTDASGAYRFNLVLKTAGQGSVSIRVYYGSVELAATAGFTAAPGQLATLSQPFTVTQRRLQFAGALRHSLVPGMAVKSRQVRVSSPTLGELCVDTRSLPSENYSCSAQVDATEPFSLTYTVSGDWGTQVISGVSATTFPPLGGSFTLNRQLDLAPTTLHLTGTVRREDSSPLASARVEIGSPALVLENGITPADTTDAAGGYDFYVLLKDGAVSNTLTYSVTQSVGSAVETWPFEAAAGQVAELERSFVYNGRYIQFAGSIGNALAPGQPVWATRVEISSPTLGRLCAWSGAASQTYACALNLRSSEPFSVTYAIGGDWGSAVVTRPQPITPPAVGTRLDDTFGLAVAPTTLNLRGTLRDPQGQPLAGARVRIYGLNQFSRNEFYIDATAGADGRYSAHAVLKSGVLSGSLDYLVTFGTVQRAERVGFTAAAGQLAAVERDITLNERRLEFKGEIGNALVPGMAVPITA